jgi:hypothetical protein
MAHYINNIFSQNILHIHFDLSTSTIQQGVALIKQLLERSYNTLSAV